jgi:HEAT repeat protein
VSELDALFERLGASDRETQRRACDEAVGRLRDDAAFRREIVRVLRDGTPIARFSAAFVLFQEGPTLRILPALLDALELDDGDLRWSAAHMLATLGRSQAEVLPVLLQETQAGASPRRRRMALYAVRELAPEQPASEQAFLSALADPHPDVRRAALSSLAKLAAPSLPSLQRVLQVLAEDADLKMRRIAAVLVPDLLSHHPALHGEVRAALEAAAAAGDADLSRATAIAERRLPTDPT